MRRHKVSSSHRLENRFTKEAENLLEQLQKLSLKLEFLI